MAVLQSKDVFALGSAISKWKRFSHFQNSDAIFLEEGRVLDAGDLSESPFDSVFIECSAHCGCAGRCSNRLSPVDDAQRLSLQIFRTERTGFACRTLKNIRKG